MLKCCKFLFGSILVIAVTCSWPNSKLSAHEFIAIDFPGAYETYLVGINGKGEILGTYRDSIGYFYGFLYADGNYTTIDGPPDAILTFSLDINDSGQILGCYSNGLSGAQYFLYNGGTYTIIDFPPYDVLAIAEGGINESEQMVLTYTDSVYPYFLISGFLYDNGLYTSISGPSGANNVIVSGINDSGQIVGSYQEGSYDSSWIGFLYDNGSYTIINPPDGLSSIRADDINESGQIVGSYDNQGFLYDSGTLTTFSFPGAETTYPARINESGQIVGNYYINDPDVNPDENSHGFIAYPPGPPIADAGPDQQISSGEVSLDGSGSFDPEGTIESYEWSLNYKLFNLSMPSNNKTATGETPTVSGLVKGYYDVTLTVTDNDGLTDTDTMTIAYCFISALR